MISSMQVTYIDHSGFLLEGENHTLLFDYYRGNLPHTDGNHHVSVFVSHHHPDHLSAEAFSWGEQAEDTRYYLGCDITLNAKNCESLGISDSMRNRCIRMHHDDVVEYNGIRVQALRSTDMGVAFLVQCEGKNIFHAGDLGEWIWHKDEAFDRSQVERYYMELEKIREIPIDAAFLPLDPRLEAEYWRGFDAFARLIDSRKIFPMHMVDDYAIIRRLKSRPVSAPYRDRIMEIHAPGESFRL